MKKVLLVGCLILLVTVSVNAGQKVTLVTDEWEPYTSNKMEGYGFFTEIVTAIFKEAGLEVEYQFFPWKRCELNLRNGTVFAAFPYKMTEGRKATYDFSDAIANSTGRFFYLKSRIKSEVTWEKLEDLKSYKIGGTRGYWYEKEFNTAGLIIDYGTSDKLGFKKLKGGRFDLLATEELVGWELIKKLYPNEIDDFGIMKQPLNKDELRLMISRVYPDSAAITEKVNTALQRIKDNGVYSAILKKYKIAE